MYKFFRFITKSFRKTPDFILIGASKCGTTTLYNHLCSHPEIARPLKKEINFFNWKYNKGLNWYKVFFPLKITRKMVFEASAKYLTSKHAPERIFNMNGAMRLIVILREPLAKAVSLWTHNHPNADNHLFLDSPFLNYYLDQSKYHLFIQNWFDVFPDPTKFLFIKSEDLFKQPNIIFHDICRFLSIKSIAVRKRKDNFAGSIITEEIQEALSDYFDETKKAIEKLTGIKWD